MNRIVFGLVMAMCGVGCKPSPETFAITSRSGQAISGMEARSASLVEGDVLVVDLEPRDDDHDAMDLCVTATSSATEQVEIRRVRGYCRRFVIAARAVGSATLEFSARDGSTSLAITVTEPPP